MPFATVLKIKSDLPDREQAIIMLAGPAMSLALSLAFLVMVPLGGSLAILGIAGCGMNLVATVSALLPFSPMDGEKIRTWNWMAWLAVFLPVLALYLVFVL